MGSLIAALGLASIPVSFAVGAASARVSDRALTAAALVCGVAGCALLTQAGHAERSSAYFAGAWPLHPSLLCGRGGVQAQAGCAGRSSALRCRRVASKPEPSLQGSCIGCYCADARESSGGSVHLFSSVRGQLAEMHGAAAGVRLMRVLGLVSLTQEPYQRVQTLLRQAAASCTWPPWCWRAPPCASSARS